MNRLVFTLFFSFGLLIQPALAQFEKDIEQDAEIQVLKKELQALKNSNFILVRKVNDLDKKLTSEGARLDSVEQSLAEKTTGLGQNIQGLDTRIKETGEDANQRFDDLREALGKNSMYWMLAFLLAIVMAGWVFFFLRKRLLQNSSKLESEIAQTKKSLEEEGVKLDAKLAELLESQLKLWAIEREVALKESEKDKTTPVAIEPDHSLALKVADEIIRIQQNINHMDPNTRGLKQLSAAVRRIQDNFEANGYEIVDMLNKPFDLGMKVIANFRPDETLQPGAQIITRIIKPQINYNGVMIQAAQIEVSQG